MVVAVEALDGCLPDRAVHPFDLVIRPWMAWLCQAILDVEIGTCRLEGMASERHVLGPHYLDVFRCTTVTCRIGEMCAIVGENPMDFAGNGCRERPEKVTGDPSGSLFNQMNKGELGSAASRVRRRPPSLKKKQGKLAGTAGETNRFADLAEEFLDRIAVMKPAQIGTAGFRRNRGPVSRAQDPSFISAGPLQA